MLKAQGDGGSARTEPSFPGAFPHPQAPPPPEEGPYLIPISTEGGTQVQELTWPHGVDARKQFPGIGRLQDKCQRNTPLPRRTFSVGHPGRQQLLVVRKTVERPGFLPVVLQGSQAPALSTHTRAQTARKEGFTVKTLKPREVK